MAPPSSLPAEEAAEEEGGGWPVAEVIRTGTAVLVEPIADRDITGMAIPPSPWGDAVRCALVLPLAAPGQDRPAGILIVGMNPRRPLDGSYRSFCELLVGPIATAIANARAYEEERRRAEMLAELDRAKTAFFSNVSHEFRTPLTLLLGPLEDTLAAGSELAPEQREALDTAHRNALRLLRLVNTLLDFSRIEAGRIDAVYEPVDLALSTAELASVFRSAIERAGLRLVVDTPPLREGVEAWVDREMWEKIVLNLLSNAFKFTLDGSITVRLRSTGDDWIELSVADTGVGIPEEEIAQIFERFHRIKRARARSQEGTGIGLALVQELVRLHGGNVRVESRLGRGTTFTVTIPSGSAHLPEDRLGSSRSLASTALGAAPFVEEALRWSPGAEEPAHLQATQATEPARILLADDNADMRDYVRRLLAGRWAVEAVPDGAAALASVQASGADLPDLVIADVMMSGLDGFELLRALRGDPRTGTLPVILLSARAGDEARVEGLEAGADDYLVKPFSARELVARVAAHLATARVRKQAAERDRQAREEAEAASRAKDEFLAMLSHELRNPIGAISNAAHALATMAMADERLLRLGRIITRQSAQLTGLLDDLLDVARVTAGKIELRRRPLDLAELAESCARTLASGHSDAHRLEIETEPAWIEGDPTRIEQVVTNLLENALKYTPPGGTVRLRVAPEAGEAVVRIEDTGVGIAPEVLPRIFELFVQGERSLDRPEGGLGIGLTMVQRLVALHGGRVEAHSNGRGRGSEFVVRLPLREAVEEGSGLAVPTGKSSVPAGGDA